MEQTLTYRLAAQTDVGLKRSANEDFYSVFEIDGYDAAFVVADGMGGLAAGDVASSTAVAAIEAALRERLAAGDTPQIALDTALKRANDAVNAIPRPGREGAGRDSGGQTAQFVPANALIGTTAVAVLVKGATATIAHAGDSRAYLLREGALRPLTDDHSYVAERVKAGDMTEAEARRSRFRNMITRAIGIEATVRPDLTSVTLAPGDLLLVCTDGLTTMLEDDEIADLLHGPRREDRTLELRAAALIEAANKRGGSDNTTVVLLRAYDPSGATEAARPITVRPPERPATPPTRSHEAPARPAQRMPGMAVVDMDARRMGRNRERSGGAPPVVQALAGIGGLAVLLTLGTLAVPSLRTNLAKALESGSAAGATPAPSPTPAPSSIDFASLRYGTPEEFFKDSLARGDVLGFVHNVGLYFLTPSGALTWVDRSGREQSNSPTTLPERMNVHLLLKKGVTEDVAALVMGRRTFFTADPQGNLYFSITQEKRIVKLDRRGKVLWEQKGFYKPEAITLDDQGNIYVVENNLIKVLRVRPGGSS